MRLVGLDKACQMLVCKFEDSDKETVITRVLSHFGVKVKKVWA